MLRFVIFLCAMWATAATAQVPDDAARVDLLPGWREADGTHVAGLRIRLAPGWKTYWRAPGDGGIPPMFNWTGSGNLSGAQVHFPIPEVFHQNGLRSVGYEDEVILPLILSAGQANDPIALSANVEIGVCEDICVPMQFSFQGELLPAGVRQGTLAAALEDRPVLSGPMQCQITPIRDGLQVTATAILPWMGSGEAVVVEAGMPGVWVSEPDMQRDGMTLRVTADMVPPSGKPFALARNGVRLTLFGDGQAVEIIGCS